MTSCGLGIDGSDMTFLFEELGVPVIYKASTSTLDQFGGTVYSFSANVTATWIFYKRGSKLDLAKFGIIEVGDAYVIVPSTVTINLKDRIVYDGETYEYNSECVGAKRQVAGVTLYSYYTLKRVI